MTRSEDANATPSGHSYLGAASVHFAPGAPSPSYYIFRAAGRRTERPARVRQGSELLRIPLLSSSYVRIPYLYIIVHIRTPIQGVWTGSLANASGLLSLDMG